MLRIGLLGASQIAPTAVIAPALTRDDVEVVAVAARDRLRAVGFAEVNDIPFVSADYGDLIARSDVDLVYNGLPPSGHLQWTKAALAAGKPVLCEKPFAMNAGEAQEMADAAAAAGLPLIEAFHYRFHAVNRRAEDLIRSGALGDIHEAYADFEVSIPKRPGELRWQAELGGGSLMDLGCYPIHLLRTLLGEEPTVREAQGVFEDGVDVTMRAVLDFPSGCQARIASGMRPKAPMAQVTVTGSKGRLRILNYLDPHLGCRFSTDIDGQTTHLPTEGPTTYEAQLAHVVEVVVNGAAPLTGGVDAVANMAVIDKIYELARR